MDEPSTSTRDDPEICKLQVFLTTITFRKIIRYSAIFFFFAVVISNVGDTLVRSVKLLTAHLSATNQRRTWSALKFSIKNG